MGISENKGGRPAKSGKKPFTEIFCQLIRGETQQTAADKIGVSRQNIGKWLSGSTTPDIETLCKIADAYNVTTDYLLGRTLNKTTDTELQAVCEYTGLSEKAIDFLHILQKRAKGECLSQHYENTIQQLITQIDEAQNDLNQIYTTNPELQNWIKDFQIAIEINNKEKRAHYEDLLKGNELFDKAFGLYASIAFDTSSIDDYKQWSIDESTAILKAFSMLFSSNKSEEFGSILRFYLFTDFSARKAGAIDVTASKENTQEDYLITLPSSVLESAFLGEIQNFIRNIKPESTDFLIWDITQGKPEDESEA